MAWADAPAACKKSAPAATIAGLQVKLPATFPNPQPDPNPETDP